MHKRSTGIGKNPFVEKSTSQTGVEIIPAQLLLMQTSSLEAILLIP